jgi:hypothetical protein
MRGKRITEREEICHSLEHERDAVRKELAAAVMQSSKLQEENVARLKLESKRFNEVLLKPFMACFLLSHVDVLFSAWKPPFELAECWNVR